MRHEPENALPRTSPGFSRRGNRTSNSSTMTETPLRLESGRRFEITLSISSHVPDLESQPSELVLEVEHVEQVPRQEEIQPPVLMEELEFPQPPFLESDRSEYRTLDMQDIPVTPPENSVRSQSPPPPPSPPRIRPQAPQRSHWLSQLSLPHVVHRMFRPGAFPQSPIKKNKSPRRNSILIVLIILLFCGTSCLYVALVFSLSSFPVYAHALFSTTLLFEFVSLIKALWDHANFIKTQRKLAVSDAPPRGSIIQGANNWEREPDRVEPTPDLEIAGAIPPAYGQYRGSVRIHDADISWLPTGPMTEHRRSIGSPALPIYRPPPYLAD